MLLPQGYHKRVSHDAILVLFPSIKALLLVCAIMVEQQPVLSCWRGYRLCLVRWRRWGVDVLLEPQTSRGWSCGPEGTVHEKWLRTGSEASLCLDPPGWWTETPTHGRSHDHTPTVLPGGSRCLVGLRSVNISVTEVPLQWPSHFSEPCWLIKIIK